MALQNPVIQKILNRFKEEFDTDKINTKKAWTWFRKTARRNFANIRTAQLERDRSAIRISPMVGDIVMFHYPDPKYKKTLPYYDRFPLVVILDASSTHMLGLNLHYLAPQIRQIFLWKLLDFRNEKRFRANTRLKQISWEGVIKIASSSAAKHAVHQYILDRVESRFIKVDPKVWGLVSMLPTERFVGASKGQVWGDIK